MSPQKPSQSRKSTRATPGTKNDAQEKKRTKDPRADETLMKNVSQLTLGEALQVAQELGASWRISRRGGIRMESPREPLTKTRQPHLRKFDVLTGTGISRAAWELADLLMHPKRVTQETNEVQMLQTEIGPALQELIDINLLQHKTKDTYELNPWVAFNGKEETRQKMLGRWGQLGEADSLEQRWWSGSVGELSAAIHLDSSSNSDGHNA